MNMVEILNNVDDVLILIPWMVLYGSMFFAKTNETDLFAPVYVEDE
jgi:hypothetical protein|tara:strand:- start:76 stop:213 length:138 start_codon:yes stop_codon:yes gene_type:complete